MQPQPSNANGQWTTFILGDELFALPVDDVQEVVMEHPLTPVPLAPRHILGMLNLRGQVIPAIDMRHQLGMTPHDPSAPWKLLVLRGPDGSSGVVVDDIGDVLTLPDEDWRPPPDTLSPEYREWVFGLHPSEPRVVLGLSVRRLFSTEERAAPAEARSRR